MVRTLSWIALAATLSLISLSKPGHALPVSTTSSKESDLSTFLRGTSIRPVEDTSIAQDLNTKDKPRKKKRKKTISHGPPRVRVAAFNGPTFDRESIPALTMNAIEMPWRHRMAYDVEWTVNQAMLKKVLSGLSPEIVSMDIHLLPLDPGRSTELLLTRVPVLASRVKVHIRTEIPEGWYRLQFHFWEEPQAKVTDEPRQLGVWRGPDAIKVTTLGPTDLEWDEYIMTVSQETKQESLGKDTAIVGHPESEEIKRLRHALWEEHAEDKKERDEFRMPSSSQGSVSTIFSRSWKALVPGLAMPTSSDRGPFQRTVIPQGSFQLKKELPLMDRDGESDFTDLELEDIEEMINPTPLTKKQKQQLLEQQQQQPQEKKQPIVTEAELSRLDNLMLVWNNDDRPNDAVAQEAIFDDDGMDEDETYGRPLEGLSDLHIRIENGRDTLSSTEAIAWRANKDRTVSWKTNQVLQSDRPLFTIDLIPTPAPKSDDEGLTKAPTTRAELIQRSLEQPRVALLSDNVPGSWGAVVVRIPSWVEQGTFQVRVRGTGHAGMQWADVSQPFFVQSDPYLYA
ncbi:hypothetical protein BGZ83_003836 [Gryganskiella cystojenkinii]|nr:hypothetical protein BGZ83_003836 [Gryganskiella cystojenkinii]